MGSFNATPFSSPPLQPDAARESSQQAILARTGITVGDQINIAGTTYSILTMSPPLSGLVAAGNVGSGVLAGTITTPLSGSFTLIPAVAGKKIRVVSMIFTGVGAATDAQYYSGANPIGPSFPLATLGSIFTLNDLHGHIQTNAGEALILKTGAVTVGVKIGMSLKYILI